GRIRHLGRDFHPPVHRARVHHDRPVGKLPQPGGVQAVTAAVLAHAREGGRGPPLPPDPPHPHHLAPRHRRGQGNAHPPQPEHGQASTATGSRVGGAISVTSAPRVWSSSTLERATRLCRTSPTIVTRSPAGPPPRAANRRRIVNASSSAWVGCSWAPSPALIT